MSHNPSDHAFSFEARKAGLSQTRNGYFLRLELDPTDLPPALSESGLGQRFFVVLTPMPDDMPEPSSREVEEGDRAIAFAAMLCKNEDFQRWAETYCADKERAEERTANWLRKQIGVQSRSQLRTNPGARTRLYDINAKYFEEASPDLT